MCVSINPNQFFQFIIRNLAEPYQICSNLLNVHLETSGTFAKEFQVNPSDSKYSKCFSGTSYFCLTGPLRLALVTMCLNTTTQGSDDLVCRLDKTH